MDELSGNHTREWTLTAPALQGLLGVLDRDPDVAAHTYEQLRQRTIGLFRWWGAGNGEDLADRTLDRVARKLAEGAVVPKESLAAYLRGVARLVFYESTRDPHRQTDQAALAELTTLPLLDSEPEMLACFDRCLAALNPSDRELVLRYYGNGKAKDVRSQLAGELALSATALRIRVHRIRARLEQCVTDRLACRP